MEYLGSISKFYENRTKFFFFFFLHSLILAQKENNIEKRSKKFSTNVAIWKQSLIEGYSQLRSWKQVDLFRTIFVIDLRPTYFRCSRHRGSWYNGITRAYRLNISPISMSSSLSSVENSRRSSRYIIDDVIQIFSNLYRQKLLQDII